MMSTEKPVETTKTVRCAIDVCAGVVPGKSDPEHYRQWTITSEEWYNATAGKHAELLTELAGKAGAYATYLQLQPDRFNWVKLEWVWF